MKEEIKILGYTNEPDRIAAAGARISTTTGDALEIFNKSSDSEKNQNLIKKVLKSGHKTIVEHINFNLAFVNVSAYVEQFMLEFRLASFTVKSRRYVDFSNMGFVVPAFVDAYGKCPDNKEELQKRYNEHMSFLFKEYGDFVDAGIPKEDARFLLPYSYRSNFYCTVNARELYNILYSMLYGRGMGNTEIRKLGEKLLEQATEICPYIYKELTEMCNDNENNKISFPNITGIDKDLKVHLENSVELLNYTKNPEIEVARAALIGHTNIPTKNIDDMLKDKDIIKQIIEYVLSGKRPRELEQINFTFRINGITLAAITHLTRHRMQSIIIPPFYDVCKCERYMIPDTVKADEKLLQRYKSAYAKTKNLYDLLNTSGLNKYEISYLYLSGNVIDITSTMNGRELLTFFGLRTCSRTQWETRGIAIKMLNLLRNVSPLLFNNFGPNCFITGNCPEGKMTCGKYSEVQNKFSEAAVSLQ